MQSSVEYLLKRSEIPLRRAEPQHQTPQVGAGNGATLPSSDALLPGFCKDRNPRIAAACHDAASVKVSSNQTIAARCVRDRFAG